MGTLILAHFFQWLQDTLDEEIVGIAMYSNAWRASSQATPPHNTRTISVHVHSTNVSRRMTSSVADFHWTARNYNQTSELPQRYRLGSKLTRWAHSQFSL